MSEFTGKLDDKASESIFADNSLSSSHVDVVSVDKVIEKEFLESQSSLSKEEESKPESPKESTVDVDSKEVKSLHTSNDVTSTPTKVPSEKSEENKEEKILEKAETAPKDIDSVLPTNSSSDNYMIDKKVPTIEQLNSLEEKVSSSSDVEIKSKVEEEVPEELAYKATDDDNLENVIDDFDKAIKLDSNNGLSQYEQLQQIQSVQSHLSAGILFSDPRLKIPAPILEALTLEMRFDKPSAIQATTIPIILSGGNLIAQAQAGAGKTIAFAIGMLSCIDTSRNNVQALCLTPTRELAQQIISDAIARLSTRIPNIRCEPALPGYEVERGSRCTSHIVVGTPGTVKKWLGFRYLDLSTVRVFVLDEADAMVAKSQQVDMYEYVYIYIYIHI